MILADAGGVIQNADTVLSLGSRMVYNYLILMRKNPREGWPENCISRGLTNVVTEGGTLGRLSKGIRNALRLLAGVYLLLNLCVATIPRCDAIFAVLQHGMTSAIADAPSCHQPKSDAHRSFQVAHLCECTLVKFVFITLPDFDPQSYIAFRVQSSTLILFDDTKALISRVQGPEPPYPRWSMI